MKELVASDAATVEALTARLKQAETIAEFQCIQCVLMLQRWQGVDAGRQHGRQAKPAAQRAGARSSDTLAFLITTAKRADSLCVTVSGPAPAGKGMRMRTALFGWPAAYAATCTLSRRQRPPGPRAAHGVRARRARASARACASALPGRAVCPAAAR